MRAELRAPLLFRRRLGRAARGVALLLCLGGCGKRVTVGSKLDTESVILGEMASQLARHAGAKVDYRRELGGTRVVWDALVAGQIDIYPEYTGTLTHQIFAGRKLQTEGQLIDALAASGIEMTRPLGFNNGYALGMPEDVARRFGIRTISDLRKYPQLRLGFSNEFMDRADGWPGLSRAYDLPQTRVTGLDHDLAYRGLADHSLDVTDVYTTDAAIALYHLRLLADDLHYFPEYRAVFLFRSALRRRDPGVIRAVEKLQGRIGQEAMIGINARAKVEKVPEARVAADFLSRELGVEGHPPADGFWRRLKSRTWEHLELVSVSLLAAVVLAVPLGVVAARFARVGQMVLGSVAAIYTIPSLALLVFMIPLLGIGWTPAVVALFLYSLLPIVRNTHAGLKGIPNAQRESADALGLSPFARLLRVELPLAMPAILAGIQTSAVLNVGTATLGALIGAGGYGQPILSGIRLVDNRLILEGAVPAALMAMLAQGLFDLIGRFVIPRGLRLAHGAAA